MEQQRLAAGGIIVGYGLMAGLGGMVLAMVLANGVLAIASVIRLNKGLGVFLLVCAMVLAYRVWQNTQQRRSMGPVPGVLVPAELANWVQGNKKMGLGMFAPNVVGSQRLYFYGKPSKGKMPDQIQPMDSLVFGQSGNQIAIGYAPSWFMPAHLKLDYGLLYLRVNSISRNFCEVVVNETNGQTAFVDRYAGELRFWPDFILQCNSISPLDEVKNPIKIKPLLHASGVSGGYGLLVPFQVQAEWVKVDLLKDSGQPIGKQGWIKWRDGDWLLVNYSLLF